MLGTLFRSRDFIKQETELVVIVTPYMVRPTARQNLARPDDGLAPASDLKANFLGHINRIYGKGRELPPGGLKGDTGSSSNSRTTGGCHEIADRTPLASGFAPVAAGLLLPRCWPDAGRLQDPGGPGRPRRRLHARRPDAAPSHHGVAAAGHR